MNQDDYYLLKWVQAGVPTSSIARRLSISEDEVRRRVAMINTELKTKVENGYTGLVECFNVFCMQYMTLGQTLKVLGGAIGSIMESTELEALVGKTKEETLHNLRTKAIVLRAFVPPTPEQLMEDDKNTMEQRKG